MEKIRGPSSLNHLNYRENNMKIWSGDSSLGAELRHVIKEKNLWKEENNGSSVVLLSISKYKRCDK